MKIAIVVDWLAEGGGENVLAETLKVFPDATVHALLDRMSDADHTRLGIPRARTSWFSAIPGIERSYRSWLALMPMAVRSLDVRDADVVLSISHAVAKAPRVRQGQRLLCLSLSPMRYAWDLRDQYLAESGLDRGWRAPLARWLLTRMRDWDRRTSARVDAYASISRYIAERVKRNYGRGSEVIYPPVDTEFFARGGDDNGELTADGSRLTADGLPRVPGRYYVTASRFVPYKRMDLIVRAFAGDPARHLVVIGAGPDAAKVRSAAAGATNITFTGFASREQLRGWFRGARAFVFAAEEDFGIVPVEAQACGVPVIAYGRGGVLETIVPLGQPGASGVFFDSQTVPSIRDAVARFEASGGAITGEACRASALRFSAERFRTSLAAWVADQSARPVTR